MVVSRDLMSQEEIRRLYILLEKHFSDMKFMSDAEKVEFDQLVNKAAKINGECPRAYLEREATAYHKTSSYSRFSQNAELAAIVAKRAEEATLDTEHLEH